MAGFYSKGRNRGDDPSYRKGVGVVVTPTNCDQAEGLDLRQLLIRQF